MSGTARQRCPATLPVLGQFCPPRRGKPARPTTGARGSPSGGGVVSRDPGVAFGEASTATWIATPGGAHHGSPSAVVRNRSSGLIERHVLIKTDRNRELSTWAFVNGTVVTKSLRLRSSVNG